MAEKLLICTVVLFVACHAGNVKKYCKDSSGITRKLSEEWEEGEKLCECVMSDLFYMEGGDNIPNEPIANCLWNGCPDPSGAQIYKAGDVFQNKHGETCVCTAGSDPFLADTYTLFHEDCSGQTDLISQEFGG